MRTLAKTMHILTAPNIMATVMAIILANTAHMTWYEAFVMIFFLGIFPCGGYLLAYIVPSWRKEGCKIQRRLVLIFSVLGYIVGMIAAVLCDMSVISKVAYCTYLLSGTCIFVCSAFKFPASGHSCGAVVPVAILCVYASLWWLFGIIAVIISIHSSLAIKRHTFLQLMAGCSAALCSLFAALFLLT